MFTSTMEFLRKTHKQQQQNVMLTAERNWSTRLHPYQDRREN